MSFELDLTRRLSTVSGLLYWFNKKKVSNLTLLTNDATCENDEWSRYGVSPEDHLAPGVLGAVVGTVRGLLARGHPGSSTQT